MSDWSPSRILAVHEDVTEEEEILLIEEVHERVLATQINYNLPTEEEWSRFQSRDPDFKPLIDFIRDEKLPSERAQILNVLKEYKNYVLDSQNILYRATKVEESDELPTLRKCVPQPFRQLLLEEFHDSAWSGAHLGREKTYERISQSYFFPRMRTYIAWWTRTCPKCQAAKRKVPIAKLPLGSITADRPWQRLSMDLWSACVTSTRGYIHVLTVIDIFSRFVLAIPLKNKTAAAVAYELISQVYPRFGIPETIHSDRGTEFVNETLKIICEWYKVNQTKTTAYHPQGNAIAERIHQFFSNALTAYVRIDQRDWDIFLPILVGVYQDRVHESLNGMSPSQVLLGRKLGSISVIESEESLDKASKLPMPLFVRRLKLALLRAQEQIKEWTNGKLREDLSQQSNDKPKKVFVIGDKVGVLIHSVPVGVKSSKLYPLFKGPYTIRKVTHEGKVVYLTDTFGKEIINPYSYLQLSLWKVRKENIPKALSKGSTPPEFMVRITAEDQMSHSAGNQPNETIQDLHPSEDNTLQTWRGSRKHFVRDEEERNSLKPNRERSATVKYGFDEIYYCDLVVEHHKT